MEAHEEIIVIPDEFRGVGKKICPICMHFCDTKAGPVSCNLSGSPQEDKPREERLNLAALMPNTVLLSMLPGSRALSAVWRVNYKSENNV